MFYKNKNIRSNYSVMFVVFIVGAVVTGFSLLMIICGLVSAVKAMGDVQHIDTVLQGEGNHALNSAYFDITEVPVFLSKAYKKSNFYLLTDGNEYRLAEIDKDDY